MNLVKGSDIARIGNLMGELSRVSTDLAAARMAEVLRVHAKGCWIPFCATCREGTAAVSAYEAAEVDRLEKRA